jgi:hypothetical protein
MENFLRPYDIEVSWSQNPNDLGIKLKELSKKDKDSSR